MKMIRVHFDNETWDVKPETYLNPAQTAISKLWLRALLDAEYGAGCVVNWHYIKED